jgi:hypothetical protein
VEQCRLAAAWLSDDCYATMLTQYLIPCNRPLLRGFVNPVVVASDALDHLVHEAPQRSPSAQICWRRLAQGE